MKLGSLFDGSGGFPLAGSLFGIEPVWASEIEPFPIRVTKLRFPGMKHLGSVTDVNGAEIEPVDIITFGSPCQDISVAGKQAGIHEGQRSKLFFEAIRIIKEMRNATSDKYPRFAVWENVPGAFSSNKGADFKAVLEALCGVREWAISVPQPACGWKPAGLIVGNGYSIAWRVYDAQYWGVPQRRKRIYLVADFGSERAGEILFESESMRGNPEKSCEKGQGAPGDAEGSAGGSGRAWSLKGNFIDRETKQNGCGWSLDVSYTLDATDRHGVVCYAPEGNHCGAYREDDTSATLQTGYHYGGGGDAALVLRANMGDNKPAVCFGIENHANDSRVRLQDEAEPCQTLTSRMGTGGGNVPLILEAVSMGNGQLNQMSMEPIANALDCMHDQQAVVYPGVGITSPKNGNNPKPGDPAPTLTNEGRNYLVKEAKPRRKYIVRRLTPTECGRLQGFPDGWTDGANGSDTAIYKMWGNGIALPCVADVLGRIAKEIGGEET